MLLCQKQEVFDNLKVQDPPTHIHQVYMEKKFEVLLTVGAQTMLTSGDELSKLGDMEFHREKIQLFWVLCNDQGKIALCDKLLMGNPEKSFVLDNCENKEKLLATTPVFDQLVRPTTMLGTYPNELQNNNVPTVVANNLFGKILQCLCFSRQLTLNIFH